MTVARDPPLIGTSAACHLSCLLSGTRTLYTRPGLSLSLSLSLLLLVRACSVGPIPPALALPSFTLSLSASLAVGMVTVRRPMLHQKTHIAWTPPSLVVVVSPKNQNSPPRVAGGGHSAV